MRIGIDIRHLCNEHHSGIGYYTINLINALSKIAPDDNFFLFATGSTQRLSKLPTFNGKNIHLVKRSIPNKLLTIAMKAPGGKTLESFFSEKIDCWLFPNLNIVRTNLPYAITMHDVSFSLFPQFFTPKQTLWHRQTNIKQLLEDARQIFSVSKKTKYDIQDIFNIEPKKIKITHLGVDQSFHSKREPSDQNYIRHYGISAPYILTLSTLEPRKNIESVIEAFDHIEDKELHLVIAGGSGWKTTSISQSLIRAKHRDRIHILGYVADKHKAALMREASAFIFPSFYEGFGLPILEAMACGAPVITSFTSSMPEVAQDAAIFVDPFNTRDIEQAINCICKNLELQSLLSKRGIAQAKKFTWEKTAKITLKQLKLIVN